MDEDRSTVLARLMNSVLGRIIHVRSEGDANDLGPTSYVMEPLASAGAGPHDSPVLITSDGVDALRAMTAGNNCASAVERFWAYP